MSNSILVRKLKDKVEKDEKKLLRSLDELDRIWEKTNLDPKDSSYLVEKTMRFEMARENLSGTIMLIKEIIEDYKKLCAELQKDEW